MGLCFFDIVSIFILSHIFFAILKFNVKNKKYYEKTVKNDRSHN